MEPDRTEPPDAARALGGVVLYVVTFVLMLQAFSGVPLPATTLVDNRLARGAFLLFVPAALATALTCAVLKISAAEAGLGRAGALRKAALGFGLGAGLLGIVAGLPWLLGQLVIAESRASARDVLATGLAELALFAPQSSAEELVVRGVAFQQIRRWLGAPVAILVSGTIFGLLHLRNPGVSALAVINISLTGFLLGILVVRSGSLWLTMGLHTAWNWCEAFLWGFPVSGLQTPSTLAIPGWRAGPLVSGGGFGPEASLYATGVTLLAIVAALGIRRCRMEPPTSA